MFFKNKNITFYYDKIGNAKETILILPGWGNTKSTFNNIIEKFKNDYTIYIIDYPGFGNSPIINQELTIYDYANMIKFFLEKTKIKNPIIIAHSFGGRITAILVGKYKMKVKKIILIDVAGIKRKKSLKIWLKEKIYKILKKGIYFIPKIKQEQYKQKLICIFASEDYQTIPNCMKKTFQNIIKENLKKYYKQIYCETLLIWGEKDSDTPLKDGKLLEKIIKNSALITYQNAEHFSYLYNIELTNNIISSFLKN